MDSGIESSNTNLYNRIHPTLNRSFLTGATTGVSGGLSDACYKPLLDMYGHGTPIAGIIGANGTGMIGVNWNVTLVSLQVLAYNHNGYNNCEGKWDQVINAINYATSYGIPILNASVGDRGIPPNNSALKTAIGNYPGLYVSAAGNHGNNITTTPYYPADYNLPNMITVGGWNPTNNAPYSHSNYSSTKVHLFAPGENIFSTEGATYYGLQTGTSFAAPFVAGVAALMRSQSMYLDAFSIKNIISRNVTHVTALNNFCVSKGLLNAYEAVRFTDQTFIPCAYGCTVNEQTCAANCPNTCSQEAINMGCNPAIPWCWDWMVTCISECEQDCTNTYGTSCYRGCSY